MSERNYYGKKKDPEEILETIKTKHQAEKRIKENQKRIRKHEFIITKELKIIEEYKKEIEILERYNGK